MFECSFWSGVGVHPLLKWYTPPSVGLTLRLSRCSSQHSADKEWVKQQAGGKWRFVLSDCETFYSKNELAARSMDCFVLNRYVFVFVCVCFLTQHVVLSSVWESRGRNRLISSSGFIPASNGSLYLSTSLPYLKPQYDYWTLFI